MKQTIARNLKRLRGKKSQKEAAAFLGVDYELYRKYEQAKALAPVTWLSKVRDYYKLQSIDEIIKIAVSN